MSLIYIYSISIELYKRYQKKFYNSMTHSIYNRYHKWYNISHEEESHNSG